MYYVYVHVHEHLHVYYLTSIIYVYSWEENILVKQPSCQMITNNPPENPFKNTQRSSGPSRHLARNPHLFRASFFKRRSPGDEGLNRVGEGCEMHGLHPT